MLWYWGTPVPPTASWSASPPGYRAAGKTTVTDGSAPTVMVTGAGGAALPGLIRHLRGRGHRVVAGDMDPEAIGLLLADAGHVLPAGASDAFGPAVSRICAREGVRVLIPLVDEELIAAKRLEHADLAVLTPRAEAVALFLDKGRLMGALASRGIAVPETWCLSDSPPSIKGPVVVKPRSGRGSRGVRTLASTAEIKSFRDGLAGKAEDWIVQRWIDGPEFTVSVVAWTDGSVQSVVPKRIIEKRGITWRAVSERQDDIDALGRAVQHRLRPDGPFNMQLRLDGSGGRPMLFEINPRYSTTLSLTLAAGVDEIGMLIDQAVGQRDPAPRNDWCPGVTLFRHLGDTFLDDRAVAMRREALHRG